MPFSVVPRFTVTDLDRQGSGTGQVDLAALGQPVLVLRWIQPRRITTSFLLQLMYSQDDSLRSPGQAMLCAIALASTNHTQTSLEHCTHSKHGSSSRATTHSRLPFLPVGLVSSRLAWTPELKRKEEKKILSQTPRTRHLRPSHWTERISENKSWSRSSLLIRHLHCSLLLP